MRMIKLTLTSTNRPIWVKKEAIVAFYEQLNTDGLFQYSLLQIEMETYSVNESPAKILQLLEAVPTLERVGA